MESDESSQVNPSPEYLFRWVPSNQDTSDSSYTGVYLDMETERRRSAFIRLMRNPGPYDGGKDYIFERFMHVVISLLFETEDLCWVG